MSLRRRLHIILLTLLVALFATNTIHAQNNRHDVPDDLHAYYQRAEHNVGQPVSLLIADTLEREAIRRGEKRAECMAHLVRVKYYYNRNEEQYYAAAEEAEKKCKENKQNTYYYFVGQLTAQFNCNKRRFAAARKKIQQMMQEAKEHNNRYGIYMAMRAECNFYATIGAREKRNQLLHKALTYWGTNRKGRITEHFELANLARTMGRYDEALALTDSMIKYNKDRSFYIDALCSRVYTIYKMRDTVRFNQEYARLMREKGTKQVSRNNYLALCQILKQLIDGNKEEAESIAKVQPIEKSREVYLRLIYQNTGEWDKLYDLDMQRRRVNDSAFANVMQVDLDNYVRQVEAERAQLLATNQNLRDMEEQLEHDDTEMRLSQARSEHDITLLRNNNLEISHLQAEKRLQEADAALRRQEREMEQERYESESRRRHYANMLIAMLGAAIVMAAVFMIVRIRQRAKVLAQLSESNRQLEEARKAAQRSDRVKTEFVQNMSHEIRTPLNAIVGFSQLLSMPGLPMEDDEMQEYVGHIKSNTQLLTTLVDDLIDTTEIRNGEVTMTLAPASVHDICHRAISAVTYRCPSGVKLVEQCDVEEGMSIQTDEKRVVQILTNFLTNAEKHTTKGSITLHSYTGGREGHITFAVTDTGTGVPKDEAENIFERYKKLRTFKQGTGLGLNICRIYSEKLGGRVYMDTEYTGGARFILELPLG